MRRFVGGRRAEGRSRVGVARGLGALLLLAGIAAALAAQTALASGGPTLPAHIGGVTRTIGQPQLGVGNLINHGGPTMTTNKTYAIYWAPSGYSFNASYTSTIDQFFGDVAHDSGMPTNVYAVATQYSGIQYSSTFGGSVVDTNPYPTSGCGLYEGDISKCLTDAQLITEIDKQITAQGWTRNGVNQFFMFTPSGVGSCFDPSGSQGCAYTDYCAYHGYTSSGAIYANQPYAGHSGCDEGQYPNGAGSKADPTINVVSHEHNEAITDPQLNAWYDAAGYENGDKCAWIFGAVSGTNGSEYNQTINGHHYFLQQEWSNDGSTCLLTYGSGGGGNPPTVTSFSPTSGAVGATVDVQGTNLTGANSVKFNGTSDPSFVVNSSTDITAHVPGGATTGKISVTTPNGTGTSASNFTVTGGGGSPPTVTSFTPTSGPVGTSVVVNGTNFTGVTAVKFNGTSATSYTVNSSVKITATVPSGATTGKISVTNGSGTGTSTGSFTVTAAGAPKITSFSPSYGWTGNTITINGSGFTGATSVKLGSVSATFTVVSTVKITAKVPAMARGSYKWSVTTPNGSATSLASVHTPLARNAARGTGSKPVPRATRPEEPLARLFRDASPGSGGDADLRRQACRRRRGEAEPARARARPAARPAAPGAPRRRAHRARGGRTAYSRFCRGLIDAAGPYCVAVKPQSAFFEALRRRRRAGLRGRLRVRATAGLVVIGDVKRGDIGSTARAYASAYLEPREGRQPLVDAITVSAYLGRDSLEPFVAECRRSGRGIFCLVKTSNPGGVDIQDLKLTDGTVVWHQVAKPRRRARRGRRRRVRTVEHRRCRRRDLPARGQRGAPAAPAGDPAPARRRRAGRDAGRRRPCFHERPGQRARQRLALDRLRVSRRRRRLADRRRRRGGQAAQRGLEGIRLVSLKARFVLVGVAALVLGSTALAAPRVGGRAYLVVSASGDTLLQRNADARVPIASITKLMTVLVTLEHAKLDDVVTWARRPPRWASRRSSSSAGERLTVRELIEAALIQSANDAAVALAQHVGNGSVPAFVAMMNEKAHELGLTETHFANPDGLDADGPLLERARRDEARRDPDARPASCARSSGSASPTSPAARSIPGTTCSPPSRG